MPSKTVQDEVLDKAANDGVATPDAPVDSGPLYRVVGDTKIPVSKASGKLWQSRRDQGLAARNASATCWNEAIRYYDNDQMTYRTSRDSAAGNQAGTKQLSRNYTQTENVVFANCSIMVPMLYAKNPQITVTYENDVNEALGTCIEKVGNKLLSMKTAPGLNFKPKARRAVLTALLTNNAFIKIGWTAKQDSNDEALGELEKLSTALQNAKTQKDIKAVEGQIMALEEKVNLLTPAGPWTRVMLPDRIVVDPTASEPDGSDANWMMEWDMLPTSYINAVYTTENGKTVYEPTHVLRAGLTTDQGIEDEVNNFTLIKDNSEMRASQYGYGSREALDAASMTKVWYVWDKTTRRVYMFADNNWSWPIWVWNDPLKLPRFFPYFRLWFHESVNSNAPKGEVTYYLDQQDAINEINSEVRTSRAWARRNILYDKNAISQDDVEAVLKGPDGTARGIRLPEGVTIDKALFSLTPPSLKFPELFSTDSNFAAINRIAGVNDALRGGQFKTNTTNQAIEQYQQSTDTRVDERRDLIEDFIGDIMWNTMMLCLMNWTVDDITPLVGANIAGAWKQVTDPTELVAMFAARVEGGSVSKPNSQARKQQAVQLAQAMGQFANGAPGIVVVMMKMLERAFNDSIVISDDDWQMILTTMQQALQKAGSGPNGQPEGPPQPDPNGQPQTDEGLKGQIAEKIAAMPPKAKAMLQELVQKGMPPSQALAEVEKQLGAAK